MPLTVQGRPICHTRPVMKRSMERGLNKAYIRAKNSRYWAADGTFDLQRNTVSIDTVPLSLEGYREWQQD